MNNEMNNNFNNNVNVPNVTSNQINQQPVFGVPNQPNMAQGAQVQPQNQTMINPSQPMPVSCAPMNDQPVGNFQQAPMTPHPPVKKNNNVVIAIVIGLVVVGILIALFFLISSKVFNAIEEQEKGDNVVGEENNNNNNSNNSNSNNNSNNNNNNNSNNSNSNNNNNSGSNGSSYVLSNDWKTMEFVFEGTKYTLMEDYSKFKENGWTIDLNKMGYPNGYILNANTKTYSTVYLYSSTYKDSGVTVGFINNGTDAKDITECKIWSFNVRNSKYYSKQLTFELPGGIKNGSTHDEVIAVYGKPSDDNIYRSEGLKYTTYHYKQGYDKYFDITVYDEGGVTEFSFKNY